MVIRKLPEDGLVQIGWAPEDTPRDSLLTHLASTSLSSNGVVWTGTAEVQWDGVLAAGDVVGAFIDRDNARVAYYVNGVCAANETFNSDQEKPYQLTVAFEKHESEVVISNDCHPPEEIDLIGAKSVDTSVATEWGYKFKVTPLYRGENKMNVVQSLNEKQQEAW